MTTDLRAVLRQMQIERHVPPESSITVVSIAPAFPDPIFGRPSLAYLGVLLIGAVSGVALSLWSDPLLTRVSRRRSWGPGLTECHISMKDIVLIAPARLGNIYRPTARIERLNMDFGEIFRILRRRWRVAVPALLLTVIATVGVYLAWPTTYQSSAEITLLGPHEPRYTTG